MEEKPVELSFEDYFAQLILKNERFRYTVLLAAVACLLTYLAITFVFGRDFFMQMHAKFGIRTLSAHLTIFFTLVVFRTFNIRRMLKKWQQRGKKIHPAQQYANAMIEMSIPSVAIIIIAQSFDVTVALNSPAVFIYFVFILLSVLELDLKLCIFTGVIASIEYVAVVLYYLNPIQPTDPMTLLAFPYIYVSKALILLICGVIAGLAAQQIKRRTLQAHHASMERLRIETLFGQQISPQVVEELILSGQQVVSRNRLVCVMFLDLRGFTQYCEGRSPEKIVEFQNSVLSFMIDAVNRHRGIVNQILGDGFMATFGAPLSSGHDCQDAVLATMAIVDQLQTGLRSGTLPETDVGIGLHYGEAVTGNVGTETRKQYSITGNVVILASRIEQLNKQYGSRALISREVLDQIDPDHLRVESLGSVLVKGRSEPMEIFKLA